MKGKVIALILIIITLLNFFDVLTDISLGCSSAQLKLAELK